MLLANDMWNAGADHARMVKKPKASGDEDDVPADEEDRLYIGEWCAALRVKPSKIVRESGINFGYLSQLISGQKTNPTRSVLRRIGKELGVEWYLLYEPPPPKAVIDQLRKYSTGLLKRLEGVEK